MISTLKVFAQNRKSKLITYLNSHSDDLSLEKQHQIYGAINEIDSIVDFLHMQITSEIKMERNPEEIFLFKPIQKRGFFQELAGFFKEFF